MTATHRASPSPQTSLWAAARPEKPFVLQGFPELAPHCACQETADFLSKSPNSLQTSAPRRFGAELKITGLFSYIAARGAEWLLERLGNQNQPIANRQPEGRLAVLTGQEINLPQLGDDLFGLMALPCHRSIHPKWSCDQHKGWITSRGSRHPTSGSSMDANAQSLRTARVNTLRLVSPRSPRSASITIS